MMYGVIIVKKQKWYFKIFNSDEGGDKGGDECGDECGDEGGDEGGDILIKIYDIL